MPLWKCGKLVYGEHFSTDRKSFPQAFPHTLWKISSLFTTKRWLFHISTAPTTTNRDKYKFLIKISNKSMLAFQQKTEAII